MVAGESRDYGGVLECELFWRAVARGKWGVFGCGEVDGGSWVGLGILILEEGGGKGYRAFAGNDCMSPIALL